MAHSLKIADGAALVAAPIALLVVGVSHPGTAWCWTQAANPHPTKQPHRTKAALAPAATREPMLSMTVDDLWTRCRADPEGTKQQLAGRFVELSGTKGDVVKHDQQEGEDSTYTLSLVGHSGQVLCELRQATLNTLPKAKGAPLVVRGRFGVILARLPTRSVSYLYLNARDVPQGTPTR